MAALEGGGHWYRRDGTPCHTVPKASGGGERPTTIADARKLGLLPSVTTILAIVEKPQLTRWRIVEALKLARLVPPTDDESPEAYAERIIERSTLESVTAAADEGSLIHAAIEAHYLGEPVPAAYQRHVQATVAAVMAAFPGVADWVPERRVVSDLGYAGTVDLHSPTHGIVVDFKSKAFDHRDPRKLAFDQVKQLAAYAAALWPEGGRVFGAAPRLANVFVSRTVPGHVVLHPWAPASVDRGWDCFCRALELWVAEKGYDPREVAA
jgi:hypothetical protein